MKNCEFKENELLEIAKNDDANEICQLLKNVTEDLYERGINQWTDEWKIEDIREFILKKNIYVLRYKENGKIIGIFSLEENKILLEQFPNSLYLSKVALLPKYQKQKIGEKMIQKQ
eukprot:jgi/Orpsp1_1/1176645/evm.model.c7180000058424.1